MVGRVLRTRLLYKILGANGLLIAGAVVAAAVLGRMSGEPVPAAVVATLIGLIVCVLINWLLIRLALRPLRDLQATASRVQAGDLSARAPRSPVADREMAELVVVFNGMLTELILDRAGLHRLSIGALEAAERERRRLAGELQEDAAQRLAALLLRAKVRRDSVTDLAAAVYLERLRDDLAECLEMIRRLARRLHPPELTDLGLASAVRAYARAVAEQTGLSVTLDAHPCLVEPHENVALALYRIFEEALLNAIRHADASSVRVELKTARGGQVCLTVEDDGRGMPPGTRSDGSAGIGLVGMRERAREVGGEFEIDSIPGEGTRICVRVPSAAVPDDG